MDPGPELDIMHQGLAELALTCTAGQEACFKRYLEMLYRYRNKVHLISHADYHRIALKHFLPSLLALPDLAGKRSFADIGAGAGFPSIPLKIMIPEIQCTMFESVGKKAQFLKNLVGELKLPNIEVVNDRAERQAHRSFDVVLARAAGTVSFLVKTAASMIGHDGLIVLFKSPDIDDELKRARATVLDKNCVLTSDRVYTPVEHAPMNLVRVRACRV
ncbi:MAG TPA: 16S rRNA (guanine(527)-N(7))-methyltransferase RsmG [bacterium]